MRRCMGAILPAEDEEKDFVDLRVLDSEGFPDEDQDVDYSKNEKENFLR